MEQAFCWIKLTLPGSGSWGVLLTRGEKGQFCVFWCLISCTGSLPMPTECLATRGAKPWPVPILPYQHTHIAITSYSSCLWRRDHHSQNYQMVEHGPHRGQARVAAVCQSRMLLVGGEGDTTCHAWPHRNCPWQQTEQLGLWKAGFAGLQGWGSLSSMGRCPWLTWISKIHREMKPVVWGLGCLGTAVWAHMNVAEWAHFHWVRGTVLSIVDSQLGL